MLAEIVLGTRALGYLKGQLSQGRTYAGYLLELPLDDGEIITLAPPKIPYDYLDSPHESLQMKTGGSIRAKALSLVAQMANRQLISVSRGYLLAEAFGRPGERSVSIRPLPNVTYQSEVYFLIDRQHADTETIHLVLGSARAYPSIFGLVDVPEGGPTINPGEQLTAQSLKALALHTASIVTGAYDGDSYIIWRTGQHGH